MKTGPFFQSAPELAPTAENLPDDFRAGIEEYGGCEGLFGEQYLRLYRLEELGPLNQAYKTSEFAPGILVFGSSGGGEAFALAAGGAGVIDIPFIPLRNQTDSEGNSIDLEPRVMLVGPSNESEARRILNSEGVSAVISEGDSPRQPTGNSLRGLMRLAVEARLENTAKFENASASAWYLFSARENAGLLVCFLNGMDRPTVEELGFQANVNRLAYSVTVHRLAGNNDGMG